MFIKVCQEFFVHSIHFLRSQENVFNYLPFIYEYVYCPRCTDVLLKKKKKKRHAPAVAPPTWMRLLASRAMLEKCGTLSRSCGSPPKHSSMPSSSRRMVHTHSSLVGGPLWGAELSCCRASLSASSLHSIHSWKSSSFKSEFCSTEKRRVIQSFGLASKQVSKHLVQSNRRPV